MPKASSIKEKDDELYYIKIRNVWLQKGPLGK